MRELERINRILGKLAYLWEKHPDWRFCQLMENVLGCNRNCTFYVEDDEFEKGLDATIVWMNEK